MVAGPKVEDSLPGQSGRLQRGLVEIYPRYVALHRCGRQRVVALGLLRKTERRALPCGLPRPLRRTAAAAAPRLPNDAGILLSVRSFKLLVDGCWLLLLLLVPALGVCVWGGGESAYSKRSKFFLQLLLDVTELTEKAYCHWNRLQTRHRERLLECEGQRPAGVAPHQAPTMSLHPSPSQRDVPTTTKAIPVFSWVCAVA